MMIRKGRATSLALSLFLAAATAGATATYAQETTDQLVLKDFVLTHGVMEREPIDSVASFDPSDDQAYAFARIYNDGPPAQVSVVWIREGQVHAHINLNVGTSSGWRTWSSTTLQPGEWSVQLVDEYGIVLDERTFVVDSMLGQDDMAPAAYPFDDMPMQQSGEDEPGAMMPDAESSMEPWMDDSDG